MVFDDDVSQLPTSFQATRGGLVREELGQSRKEIIPLINIQI